LLLIFCFFVVSCAFSFSFVGLERRWHFVASVLSLIQQGSTEAMAMAVAVARVLVPAQGQILAGMRAVANVVLLLLLQPGGLLY
jgi:hypothetical protein